MLRDIIFSSSEMFDLLEPFIICLIAVHRQGLEYLHLSHLWLVVKIVVTALVANNLGHCQVEVYDII